MQGHLSKHIEWKKFTGSQAITASSSGCCAHSRLAVYQENHNAPSLLPCSSFLSPVAWFLQGNNLSKPYEEDRGWSINLNSSYAQIGSKFRPFRSYLVVATVHVAAGGSSLAWYCSDLAVNLDDSSWGAIGVGDTEYDTCGLWYLMANNIVIFKYLNRFISASICESLCSRTSHKCSCTSEVVSDGLCQSCVQTGLHSLFYGPYSLVLMAWLKAILESSVLNSGYLYSLEFTEPDRGKTRGPSLI